MKTELLSPAGTCDIGRAAIDAGADAVYIGAGRFGARQAAGNSIEQIAALAEYAHAFGARVYIAMNTLLLEEEIEAAYRMAWEVYEAGADALIVQDMAFTRMELPPLALHASTQTFNLSPERVGMLADAGFSRVVLERGATLEQVRAIRRAVPGVELEAFVHGAICVCYSGQCYLGHALCGRGGNRGNCAQPCRSLYDLTDKNGRVLVSQRPLLSVSDLNLSAELEELLGAGVCSLKIEGRLKDIDYVTNNTAYYHKKLEELGVERISAGESVPGFEPNPAKSFSRGFSTYYWSGKEQKVAAAEARSIGERIGTVERVDRNGSFTVHLAPGVGPLNNGDGICFLDPAGKLQGTNVNRAEGNRIEPNRMDGIRPGVEIYRNLDRSFRPRARRQVGAEIRFDTESGTLTARDRTGTQATIRVPADSFEPASNPALAEKNLRQGLQKSGGTIFRIDRVELNGTPVFISAATINNLRRELLQTLYRARLADYRRPAGFTPRPLAANLDPVVLDYRANVANSLAEAFYREQGVIVMQRAVESLDEGEEWLKAKEVMRTPYCIRREMDACLKKGGNLPAGPLHLVNNGIRLELQFDCAACEMAVIFRGRVSE